MTTSNQTEYAPIRLPLTEWTLSRLLVAKQEFRRLGLQWHNDLTHNEAVAMTSSASLRNLYGEVS